MTNANEERELIFIPDEDGNDEEFEVVFRFEVDNGNKYIMVVPTEGDPEVDEVYAFRYEEDGEDMKLFTIDDEAEWEIVEETFNTLAEQLEVE